MDQLLGETEREGLMHVYIQPQLFTFQDLIYVRILNCTGCDDRDMSPDTAVTTKIQTVPLTCPMSLTVVVVLSAVSVVRVAGRVVKRVPVERCMVVMM